MEQNNTTLPEEVRQQIEIDAKNYSNTQEADYSQRSVNAAIAVATLWAAKAHKADVKNKELAEENERIKNLFRPVINNSLAYSRQNLIELITKALAGEGGEAKVRDYITHEKLAELGFENVDYGENSPYETAIKHGIEVWDFNGECWIIDILDQNNIERSIQYMDELESFFNGCGLSIYK